MTNFYHQLCLSFIRPARQTYNLYDLGSPNQPLSKRIDFDVHNNRNNRLVCSYYNNIAFKSDICVVYLHSLNGSRLESVSFIGNVLEKGFNFCSFDFGGAGLSQGNYLSMGFHEKFDILCVLKQISKKFNIKCFYLWGRSMGAAAVILFMSTLYHSSKRIQNEIDFDIEGIILDSPFHSLNELALQIAKERISMPQFILKGALKFIQSSVHEKAGFKISEMQLLPHVKNIQCPILLFASKDDKLVLSDNSEKIYDRIVHKDRQICYIKGEHNETRDIETINNVINFVVRTIQRKRMKSKQTSKSAKLINLRQNFQSFQTNIPKLSVKPDQNTHISSKLINKSISLEPTQILNTSCNENLIRVYSKQELSCARLKTNEDDFQNKKYFKPPKQSTSSKPTKSHQFKKIIQMFSPGFSCGSVKKVKQCDQSKQMYFRSAEPYQKNFNVSFEDNFDKETCFENPIHTQQFQKFNENNNAKGNSQNFIKISDSSFNQSPIKLPPKINSLDKYSIKLRENSGSLNKNIFQTPQKAANLFQVHSINSMHSKQKCRQFKNQFTDHLASESIIQARTGQPLNHFNIISEKLKKRKIKQLQKLDIQDKFQSCSVQNKHTKARKGFGQPLQVQRKSQLQIKMPPQMMRAKTSHQDNNRI